ncbi:MAG: class I SAM-dependent methyltransferase [Ignavibacteria bacterium]|nr:class I SAM-dependent methyltransferase [Ignavibacteria bacterium]
MFVKSAKFYDALYHFKDYKKASERLTEIISNFNPGAVSILDTACGTGKHIEILKSRYECEGLDINKELLDIACQRCPGIVFHESDMTEFNLRKEFDVVTCLFSSIAYVKTYENLVKAVATMADHLKENGLLIIEPWFSKETYFVNTITANHYDEKDMKIAWMYNSIMKDEMSVLDIHYLAGTPEGVIHFNELHELGLFDDAQYRKAMTDAGLEVHYDKEGLFGRGMYIGINNL